MNHGALDTIPTTKSIHGASAQFATAVIAAGPSAR